MAACAEAKLPEMFRKNKATAHVWFYGGAGVFQYIDRHHSFFFILVSVSSSLYLLHCCLLLPFSISLIITIHLILSPLIVHFLFRPVFNFPTFLIFVFFLFLLFSFLSFFSYGLHTCLFVPFRFWYSAVVLSEFFFLLHFFFFIGAYLYMFFIFVSFF